MKFERKRLILIVASIFIFCCSLIVVACGNAAAVIEGGAAISQTEYANAENLGSATTQRKTNSNKSGSKKSASSSSSLKTGIYIGGGEITSERKSGGGWTYDFNSNTLTFNGYYSATSLDSTLGLTKALFPDFNGKSSQAHLAIDSKVCTSLTIKVKGEYATCFGDIDDEDDYDKDGYNYYGIYAPGVDLIMDIEDDYAPMKYNPVYYPLQIYTHRDAVYCKNLTIKGGGGLRADSCIGSGINCNDLSETRSRLIARTQHGNNIYYGTVGHTTAAILASGSVTFDGGSVDVFVQNTAPKVGSIWAAYMIDVYGIKAGSLHVKGGVRVNVEMSYSADVAQNVTFKATGIYASNCTSYNGGKLHTKISTNATVPETASLWGCIIDDYTYFLGGCTTIYGELFRNGSQSFELNSFMQNYSLPFGSMSTSIEATKYNYTADISALYLRNDNGTLQYASNYLFNDAATLSSNEIDMADYADVSSNNVYAVSGDWKIKPIAGDSTSSFVALAGSISLEMSGGSTYGALNLYTYTGATIYLSGDGIVNSLNANGCNDKGVQRNVSYGTVRFNGGTVKSGWIHSGCDVIFYDGNINVDYEDMSASSPYHKWTFDFGEYADLVSFRTDLTFGSASSDRIGLYPIDGKLYSWDTYQTNGTSFRLFKYAKVSPSDGYAYYLYPEATEEERTFSMQRLAETDVFIGNAFDSKYYLANGDTLALSAGVFAKQVTRPVTTFGGSAFTEVLDGTKTTTIPDGFTVTWTRTKDGKTTKLGSDLSLTVQVKALDDDGSVYTCSISQGSAQAGELKISVFVFDYNSLGLIPQKAGASETKSFSFSFDDFKGYDDWIANNYSFIWQKDENGSGTFVDIAGTENQKTLSVTAESDDSFKALYRVRCYSSEYYTLGSAMKQYPTFYTTTTNLTYRELPSFNGELKALPADNYAGVTKSYSIGLNNCYTSVVTVWYEYSTDDGQTWEDISNNPAAFEKGVDIILSTTYTSAYGKNVTDSQYASKAVNVTFSTEMNGWKLRCVMKSGDYVLYSTDATFTVLDFAGFTVQPQSTVIIKSSDSLSLTAAFEEDYTDEDGNGISDVTYEWLYETWSNGSYANVDAANKVTTKTLYYENVSGIGSVSRYRLKVKFIYKGVSYARYSDYAYVYILFPPAFDDGGVVIDNMSDGIYDEGDSLSWTVKDNGVSFHYYKTYRFEVSKDGGDTWQSVGEAFTQSYKNTTFAFGLQSLSVADGGLYRCKVSIEKDGVTVCSHSKVVNIGVVSSLSTDGEPQSYAATSTGKLTLSAKHEYSNNLSVTYQWQGYDSAPGWTALASEGYYDTDKQAMYMFGAALSSYEKYRCLVSYKLNDDNIINAYTNEVAPVSVVVPEITAEPIDKTVWLGDAAEFTLRIDSPTENYTVLWEISNDGGKSWENAVAVIRCESGKTDYSLLCNAATYDMNGTTFRCTVTNAVGDVFESVVTEPVTLTVRSGYVKTEQELSDALENGMTEFKLLDDIVLSATLLINRNINLDLNGRVLSYRNNGTWGSVIKITDNATLTLVDGMRGFAHSNASLPLGGIICGGEAAVALGLDETATYGGGVSIENGTLIFRGGTIYNCNATYGGGIYVSDSSYLSLEGGVIDGCNATYGGGIYSESDIDIKDGNITDCTSSGTAEAGGNSDALYLSGSTLNASGGTVDGTVRLKKSSVVMPDESGETTTFTQTVYCDDSTIGGGFYLSDVVDADTSGAATVTYMDGDRVVTRLVVEFGQKAISVSLPTNGKLYVWYNGDVAYNFDEKVTDDLVLEAKWYVTAEVADNLTDELAETKSELDETKSTLTETKSELDETKTTLNETRNEIDSLNGNLNGATADIAKLNDKLSSVTAWMIVSTVLFGLSCGAIVPLLIFFIRKKRIIK